MQRMSDAPGVVSGRLLWSWHDIELQARAQWRPRLAALLYIRSHPGALLQLLVGLLRLCADVNKLLSSSGKWNLDFCTWVVHLVDAVKVEAEGV